ncbi:MAG TPA: hypothetical protein PLI18_15380 [Pirellulaceae bacterium]|nr:hypothetical protein [Pirellulaceae bacterium]
MLDGRECRQIGRWAGALILLAIVAAPASAQRPRFGSTDGGPLPTTNAVPSPSGSIPAGNALMTPSPGASLSAPTVAFPQQPLAPAGAPPGSLPFAPGAPIGTGAPVFAPQGFDPFSAPVGGGILAPPPSTGFPGVSPGLYPAPNAQPLLTGPAYGNPYPGLPNSPPSLFPNWRPNVGNWPANAFADFETGPYFKVVQDLRLIHTWIPGGEGNNVEINDTQLGVTMNYPDFLASGQPLRVSPGFMFHFWDGPSPPAIASDLPARAYSAYVDLDWMTAPENPFGGEVNFRMGLFTDFNTINMNSLMFQGTGLGRFRLTPNLAFKLGVTYLDRVRIKLLPAGGVFWKPTPDLALDIYFPRPRIAKKISAIATSDVWGYVGAEYGGGSWTIERVGGASDQVDLNDIRLFVGVDWTTIRDKRGFFEAGYVFKRELLYRYDTADDINLEDGFMLRGGLSF